VRTGTGKDLEEAVKQTKDRYSAHSLPDPGELWKLNDPSADEVLETIGKQYRPCETVIEHLKFSNQFMRRRHCGALQT
jgi:hypothetical protein